MDQKQLGFLGEKIAADYLKNKGYKVLEKNYSVKWQKSPQFGEIDLITKKDSIISFVEIKTLISDGKENFLPQDRVDFKKQRKLIKLAQIWLEKNRIPLDSLWQIDVIGILLNPDFKKAKVWHFENAVGQKT